MKILKLITKIIILILGMSNTSMSQIICYDAIKSKLDSSHFDISSGKYIALLYYKPLNCINCNSVVSAVFNNKQFMTLWGENAFILYNGIRNIEVADFQKNLEEIGNIRLKVINDKYIYNESLSIAGIKQGTDAQPFMVLFSPKTNIGYKLYLKEANVLSRIDSVVALR